MAKIIKSDSTVKAGIIPKNGTDFTIEELREHAGAEMVQMLYVGSDELMWIDEYGKYNCPEKRNDLATEILHDNDGFQDDYIAGDAFICKRNEVL